MEKIDHANGMMCTLLPLMLGLLYSSFVGAVDLSFYQAEGCSGSGLACLNIDAGECCYTTAQTFGGCIGVAAQADTCIMSNFFEDTSCSSQIGAGVGDYCSTSIPGKQYIGAHWEYICRRRRSLLGDHESNKPAAGCKRQVTPNAVLFTDRETRATGYSPAPMRLRLFRS
ncbi:unnamed protein product [Calypogeia fissa]